MSWGGRPRIVDGCIDRGVIPLTPLVPLSKVRREALGTKGDEGDKGDKGDGRVAGGIPKVLNNSGEGAP